MAKLLTLALPTYNRREACIRTVNNFINQIVENGFQDDVELLISDNCSTDGTSVQLKILAEKYPNIIDYRRQDTNLGMGGNFEYVINECHGEYICVLGDDDFYDKDIIKLTLNVIKRKNPIFIFLNCRWPSGRVGVSLDKDFYGDFSEAINLLKGAATFISPCVILTKPLQKASFEHKNWMVYEKLVRMGIKGKAYIFKDALIQNAKADEESDWQANIEKSLLYLNELIEFYIKEINNNILKDTRMLLIELYVDMLSRVIKGKYSSKSTVKNNPDIEKLNKKLKKYKRLFRIFLVISILFFILFVTAMFFLIKF